MNASVLVLLVWTLGTAGFCGLLLSRYPRYCRNHKYFSDAIAWTSAPSTRHFYEYTVTVRTELCLPYLL